MLVALLVCVVVAFADGQKKRKVLEKPYTGEARLRPGEPSLDFSFTDMQGQTVSLKQLRGKYVYIDVWATWCGPCNAEIPYLKKLEKEMEGKKIVFVGISSDSNQQAWEKFVKEKEMGGIQLFMGKKKQEMMHFFLINSIPRFILLDKKGRIVEAYMSRPSDEKTKESLLKLKGI